MPRVTTADLEQVRDNLNRRLEGHRSAARVHFERRYGYVGLDECRESQHRPGLVAVRTLTTGTAREVYDAMWNMIRALDLLP